jgi:hypothetical protein
MRPNFGKQRQKAESKMQKAESGTQNAAGMRHSVAAEGGTLWA